MSKLSTGGRIDAIFKIQNLKKLVIDWRRKLLNKNVYGIDDINGHMIKVRPKKMSSLHNQRD